MNVEQNVKTLLALTECIARRQIVKTQFATVTIPATANLFGLPLGQGKCVGVVLYLNSLVLNTTTKAATPDNTNQIYYGDQQAQFRELIAGQTSDILFCTDLQDIYVRGNGVANQVQVTIYLGQDQDFIDVQDLTNEN